MFIIIISLATKSGSKYSHWTNTTARKFPHAPSFCPTSIILIPHAIPIRGATRIQSLTRCWDQCSGAIQFSRTLFSVQLNSLAKDTSLGNCREPWHRPSAAVSHNAPFSLYAWRQCRCRNIVSTVSLGCKLDLKDIALRARNAEYNPKVCHCMGSTCCTCMIWWVWLI